MTLQPCDRVMTKIEQYTRKWTGNGVYNNRAVFYSKDLLSLYNNVMLNGIAVVMNANSRTDVIKNIAVINNFIIKRVHCNQKITKGLTRTFQGKNAFILGDKSVKFKRDLKLVSEYLGKKMCVCINSPINGHNY